MQDLRAKPGRGDQICAGCRAWQSHCEALRRQHADMAASLARDMRANLAALTQQLSEARSEAISLADELADSRHVCVDMQRMLSRCQAELPQPVIPLHEYLDLSPDTLLSIEQAQSVSPLSSGSSAYAAPDLPHGPGLVAGASLPANLTCTEEDTAGIHAARDLYSIAYSVEGSEDICLPTRQCEGAADIDGMLQNLEAMLKHPSRRAARLSNLTAEN